LRSQLKNAKIEPKKINHSVRGDYTYPLPGFPGGVPRGGGHGQEGMDELDRLGLTYNVLHTYPNGVRVGNIPNHNDKKKQKGTNQAWFPASWTPNDIEAAARHVQANPEETWQEPRGIRGRGRYKGVDVMVIVQNDGVLGTVFPDGRKQR
jgi:hypothetical protein